MQFYNVGTMYLGRDFGTPNARGFENHGWNDFDYKDKFSE